jgi:peptidoglycan hydrolase-like protein with peptidoglycan-binding domain
VIVTPGYYDPYYYDGAYYNGYYGGRPYYGGTAYYDGGPGAGSVAVPVQEELARRGYYKGPIDGVVGPGTRAAISAYQRNHGLEVSGTIDPPLLRSLRI